MFIAVVRGLSVLDFLTTEGFNPIGRIQPDREDSTRSEGVESYRSGVTPHRQQVAFRMSGTRFFVPCVSFRPSPAEVHSVRRRHAAHSGHAQVIGPTCVRERTHTRRRSAMETFEHNNFACNSIAQPFNSLYKRCNSKVAIWSCDSTPGELHAKLRPPRLASTALLETWPCARRRRRSHQQRQSPELHKRSLIPLPTSTRPWPGAVVIHLPATASSEPVRSGAQSRLDACDHGLAGGGGRLNDGGRIRGRVGEGQVGNDRHASNAHAQGVQGDGLHDG